MEYIYQYEATGVSTKNIKVGSSSKKLVVVDFNGGLAFFVKKILANSLMIIYIILK
jgi:hypothetical protein